MKKSFFALLSLILCVCFCFSGCNLFVSDIDNSNKVAAEMGEIILTREELLKGYNSYYNTFYNNSNNDANKAMEELIKYLISKKIYIKDATELLDQGKIEITDAEYNYLWYSVYKALINNIETFEKKIRQELEIDEEDEDLEQESQFVYTPYDKLAEVVFNEETGKYEISLLNKVLIEKINEETGEKEYKYVSAEEAEQYGPVEKFGEEYEEYKEYVINLINEKKLFEGQTNLTEEQENDKSISKEALRRYIKQLKNNEEKKNLSTDDESVFGRELDRIYKIVYENLLNNKLYLYKVAQIDIDEEDLLERYLEKVKTCYERYLFKPDAFTEELTKTVGSAKQYAGYMEEPNCIEDIFYIPENEDENFFYLTHIIISLSESQVQQINELKQYCQANGLDDEYYQTEFNKIVDKSKIKLDERDKNGYIVVKSTDENAISIEQMLQNLQADLAAIDEKYDAEIDRTASLSDAERNAYFNERADKFNEYIYKYSDDTGTLQIQRSMIGGKDNENWYTYALGTGNTDASFVENFVEEARNLYEIGNLTGYNTILMQNWQESNGVKTLKTQSTGYSVIMYCGEVRNLFENFDEKEFDLTDLPNDALLKMTYKRLGLTMNKTLFDLLFEECYEGIYNNLIKLYEDSVKASLEITTYSNVYSDLLR